MAICCCKRAEAMHIVDIMYEKTRDGPLLEGGGLCIPYSDAHLLQALYHGKPIVAMPFFADQLPNADKVVAKVSGSPNALRDFPPALCTGLTTVGVR